MPPAALDLEQLARILKKVDRPGDYYATGVRAVPIPRLAVDGVGPVAFPLLPFQAAQLVAAAERAPYGRGDQTLVDTDVRRAWQIQPDRLRLSDPRWQETIAQIAQEMAAGLSAPGPVEAQLYKLMIYDQGSFFVAHRDTEKAPGMYATLVVVLPSLHEGGELVVQHKGREVTLALPGGDPGQIAYAAFYADCLHELRPVVSGHRLALIYNLVRTGKGALPTPPDYRGEVAQVAALLRRWPQAEDRPIKLVLPLEHHYTLESLSFGALKGADAAMSSVVEAAALQADCAVHLAMVTIEESGSATLTGYSHMTNRDEEDPDEFEIEEVHDRTQGLLAWRAPDDAPAPFGTVPYLDEELCPPGALDDAEPDEEHYCEATGNEGASFERTWRQAALVLWPQAHTLEVLNQAGLETTLPTLAALTERWRQHGPEAEAETWRSAHQLAGHMIGTWSLRARQGWGPEREGRGAAFLRLLLTLKDAPNVRRFYADVLANGSYAGQENEAIVDGVALIGWNNAAEPLLRVVQHNMPVRPGAVASLLALLAGRSWTGPSAAAGLRALAEAVVDGLPGAPRPAEIPDWQRAPKPDAALVGHVLVALHRVGAADLGQRAAAHLVTHPDLYPMDGVVLPALLDLDAAVWRAPAALILGQAARDHLERRTAEPLAPPPNWSREARITCTCADCQAARAFLADPNQSRWGLKAAEHRRTHLESRLGDSHDVDRATEARGSPYTLLLTKNSRSYERRVAQRQRDLAALPRLIAHTP